MPSLNKWKSKMYWCKKESWKNEHIDALEEFEIYRVTKTQNAHYRPDEEYRYLHLENHSLIFYSSGYVFKINNNI